ncbi:MAG: type II toxin-antitoxin system YafQ family toxin [Verrucomicrobia bacterium]|nr:type II toxin-antitoxin system YafQ family toxin [Verrucomicrobiota bacterium]
MRRLVRTSQFKRDFKKRILIAADEVALADVLDRLVAGAPFEPRHRDHSVKGTRDRIRDCHVKSDLVLLYQIEGDIVILRRLGTHSDLFE